jgi:hypothetical protein
VPDLPDADSLQRTLSPVSRHGSDATGKRLPGAFFCLLVAPPASKPCGPVSAGGRSDHRGPRHPDGRGVGPGHSSLACPQCWPVDRRKIDHRFVRVVIVNVVSMAIADEIAPVLARGRVWPCAGQSIPPGKLHHARVRRMKDSLSSSRRVLAHRSRCAGRVGGNHPGRVVIRG